MKISRGILAIVVSVFALSGLVARAQERPTWGPMVSFPDGTAIQTGVGTIPADALGVDVLNMEVVSASRTAQKSAFRRILRLTDGRAIMYEIAVAKHDLRAEFEVTLTPWIPTAEEAREERIDPLKVESNFLARYSAAIVINDGDLLALDVLHNPRTGVKLVDYFRISAKPPSMPRLDSPVALSTKPLEINDIQFFVENFELRLNGKTIYASNGAIGGRFLWVDVPQTGRFVFSLTPLSEVDGFHRTAYLLNQRLRFNNGTDTYELSSERPLVSASGTFSVWMRLDPTFTFPSRLSDQMGTYFSIGAADRLPLPRRE